MQLKNNHNSYFDLAASDEDENSESGSFEKNTVESPNELVSKREKNIRRRVYDALNVQLAAEVLEKEADTKHIKPNYNSKRF